jgi:hypothetical protein
MTTTSQATAYPTITVRRPDGAVETVSVASKFVAIDASLFAAIKAATAAAGRGEVLSYANSSGTKAPLPQMGPGWCDRCQSYCYGDCRAN